MALTRSQTGTWSTVTIHSRPCTFPHRKLYTQSHPDPCILLCIGRWRCPEPSMSLRNSCCKPLSHMNSAEKERRARARERQRVSVCAWERRKVDLTANALDENCPGPLPHDENILPSRNTQVPTTHLELARITLHTRPSVRPSRAWPTLAPLGRFRCALAYRGSYHKDISMGLNTLRHELIRMR
jgi:hypothetical protein